jgi:hypothetical protein
LKLLVTFAAAAACTLAFAASANAAVWTGAAKDPRGDAEPAPNGPPADLKQVAVGYDDARGIVSASFELYPRVPQTLQWYMTLASCNGRVNATFDWPGRYGGMLVTIGSPPQSDFTTGPPTITRRGNTSTLTFKDKRLARLGLRRITSSAVGPSPFGPFDNARAFVLNTRRPARC